MSAILRVYGKFFDVDSFIGNTSLEIIKIYRKSERRNPKSKPNIYSGININVSDIDFNNFKGQQDESLTFMIEQEEELIRLRDFRGVDSLTIDFGAEIYAPGWCSFHFPHELMLKAGELRINLELSVYPTDIDEEGEAK